MFPGSVNPDAAALPLSGMQVLIADDCPISRMTAASVMKRNGAAVFEARDGAEALNMAHSLALQLILMDIQMPALDGLQATIALRAAGMAVPVIALTGTTDAAELASFAEAGMNDVIPKPFSPQVLLSKALGYKGADVGTATIEQQLQRVGGGSTAFAARMRQLFMKEMPAAAHQMIAAVEVRDWEQVSRLAHRMRPCMTSLQLHELAQCLTRIEDELRTGYAGQELEPLIRHFSHKLDEIVRRMN